MRKPIDETDKPNQHKKSFAPTTITTAAATNNEKGVEWKLWSKNIVTRDRIKMCCVIIKPSKLYKSSISAFYLIRPFEMVKCERHKQWVERSDSKEKEESTRPRLVKLHDKCSIEQQQHLLS